MATEVAERPWVGRVFIDCEFTDAEGGRRTSVTDKGTGEQLA